MRHALALALLLLAAPAGAATIVLDFEEEPIGSPKEFVSVECGCVRLIEPSLDEDEDLRILVALLGQSEGQAVAVGREGGSLVLEFLVPVVALSVDFGWDQLDEEGVWDVFDPVLTGFDAYGAVVAQATITPNGDGIVNQTISISSESTIARALFEFRQLGPNEPRGFLVDNLVLTTVPEPGTLGLGALACAGLLSRRGAGRAGRRSRA